MKVNWWRVLHWGIIIFFLQGAVYAAYLLFFVVEGGGPLFHRAAQLPADAIIVRRLYALETYLNTTGLAIYLAITEFLPRKLAHLWGNPGGESSRNTSIPSSS